MQQKYSNKKSAGSLFQRAGYCFLDRLCWFIALPGFSRSRIYDVLAIVLRSPVVLLIDSEGMIWYVMHCMFGAVTSKRCHYVSDLFTKVSVGQRRIRLFMFTLMSTTTYCCHYKQHMTQRL